MKKKPIYLNDLHREHTEWINELALWGEEINSFTNRLEDIARRNTGHEAMANLEHFQNQMILHGEKIDQLNHDIKANEHQLSAFAESNPVAIDHRHFEDQPELREQMDSQRKIFTEMKKELHSFLGKWM